MERIVLLKRTGWLWKFVAILWCSVWVPGGLLGAWSVLSNISEIVPGDVFVILLAFVSSAFLIRLGWKTEVLVATPEYLHITRPFRVVKIQWKDIVSFQKGPTVKNLKRVFVYTDPNQTPFNPAGDIASVALRSEYRLIAQLTELHKKYTGTNLNDIESLSNMNSMTNNAANTINRFLN
jgi:hypothetical protein